MELLPIAHVGHWFEGALYLAPVIVLVIVLIVSGRRADDDAIDGPDVSPPVAS